jgi:predicted nucleic acid-binding protein
MTRIFWDSNLFIYLFEENPQFCGRVRSIRQKMIERGDLLLTGALTVGEVLVKPLEEKDHRLVAAYRNFFANQSVVTVIPMDLNAAEHYASIRSDRTISHADAIQFACAANAGTDLFITNDARLESKTVRGIKFVSSLARAPL